MAIEVVTRRTALLGLGWGPLNGGLRMREGRAYPIEVDPRLAGGFIPELVRPRKGLDLIREILRLVAGEQAVSSAPARAVVDIQSSLSASRRNSSGTVRPTRDADP